MRKTCPECGQTKQVPVTRERTSVMCRRCGVVFDGIRSRKF